MRTNSLAPWEWRSAVLVGRASTLREIAGDQELTCLTGTDRRRLREIADALEREARRIIEKG